MPWRHAGTISGGRGTSRIFRGRDTTRFAAGGRRVRCADAWFLNAMFTKARSWYWGANVPGNPTQMLNYSGGVPQYFARWDDVKANGYDAYETN